MRKSGKSDKRARQGEAGAVAATSVMHLPLDDISMDTEWAKSYRGVLEESDVLASVEKYGVLEGLPLRVIPHSRRQGRYILIDGETRYKGARLRGDITVPCTILNLSLEEARELATKLNGWPQEAVKKASLAHVLLEALEEVRANCLPKTIQRLAVPKKEKDRLAARARVSITTIDRGLVALRKLYREFCNEDAGLAKISILECFWRKIQREPDSSLALLYRDQISLNKFLDSVKPKPSIRQERHGRRGQQKVLSLGGADSQNSPASELKASETVNRTSRTAARISEVGGFGESFDRLIDLVENTLLNLEDVASPPVLEALHNLIQAFPEKLAPLTEISRLLQRFEKKNRRLRKPNPQDGAVSAETAPAQQTLLFQEQVQVQ